MKHLNFILAGLFFLCGLCCRAQVLPLEENVVLNTKEGQIKGKLLLPGGVKTCPVVLIIAGSGPTDMDGNSAIGNLRNNSLKFLAEGLAANGIASLRFDKRGIGTSASGFERNLSNGEATWEYEPRTFMNVNHEGISNILETTAERPADQ